MMDKARVAQTIVHRPLYLVCSSFILSSMTKSFGHLYILNFLKRCRRALKRCLNKILGVTFNVARSIIFSTDHFFPRTSENYSSYVSPIPREEAQYPCMRATSRNRYKPIKSENLDDSYSIISCFISLCFSDFVSSWCTPVLPGRKNKNFQVWWSNYILLIFLATLQNNLTFIEFNES